MSREVQVIRNLNPEKRQIFTMLECDYLVQLLLKKQVDLDATLDSADDFDIKDVPALYDKAKTTIEVLELNMIKAIIPNDAFL